MHRPSWQRPATLLQHAFSRRCISDLRPFAPGDFVVLRMKDDRDRSAPTIIIRPLQQGKRTPGPRGVIAHDDVIGKRVRDVVRTSHTDKKKEGTLYRLYNMTLDEYVRFSRRLVTPIYPADANLIVSLLDLHPEPQDNHQEDAPKLEILEAGTGHGALTLYLSRAIHASNAEAHRLSLQADSSNEKLERRAIIHTTDVSPRFSSHAQTVVKNFRNGLYFNNIDFHVGDVSETINNLRRSRRRDDPFLSHAFLDLPAAEKHLQNVSEALRTDGMLMVFNPSITQITRCATKVKDEQIPLDLDRVIELGVNGGSGGREWDVRFMRPRTVIAPPAEEDNTTNNESDSDGDGEGNVVSEDTRENGSSENDLRIPHPSIDEGWSLVCRPKVGDRIIGGGFLGIWKKQRRYDNLGEQFSH